MSQSLPLRANLDWLKKTSKERLADLRAANPNATLSDSQLEIAREYGFPSWRKLKEHVERLRGVIDALSPTPEQRAAVAATPIAADDPELTQLFRAVQAGDVSAASQLLTRRPMLASARGPDGQTPLHAAAWYDDGRMAVTLMACGADPNATYGDSGHTALSWAATCGSMNFARTLVKLGAKPDLFCAAGIGALDAVQGFFDESGTLRSGAAKSGSSRFGSDGSRLPCPPATLREQISDALYIACRNGHADVVRFLLTKNPDVSFRAYLGGTPLHWAYFSGVRAVIDALLAAGADREARDDGLHCTPRAFGICVPASWGIPNMVQQRLAEDPALANLMDGRTSALHEAARAGHAHIVKLLLNFGANRGLRNGDGRTPADLAADRGHTAIVELLRSAT